MVGQCIGCGCRIDIEQFLESKTKAPAKAVLEAFEFRLSRVPATTGATPAFSNSPTEQVDEKADGEYRIAKYFRKNPKLRDELLDKMRKKED